MYLNKERATCFPGRESWPKSDDEDKQPFPLHLSPLPKSSSALRPSDE